MTSNGRLPTSALAKIPGGRLRKDAAEAWNAMNAESERRFGVTLRPTGPRSSYRSFSEQVALRRLYLAGKGDLAAVPGTSNHGLGLAVDLATPQMRHIVDQIGAKYGWAKRWSDAPTEWWHLKWRPGSYAAVRAAQDPLAEYPDDERENIRQYDDWKRRGVNPDGRKRLQADMTRQRKAIWRAAQKTGWGRAHRRERYRSLKARTT